MIGAGTVTIDCLCGTQVDIHTWLEPAGRTPSAALYRLTLDFEHPNWAWHLRRFHGGKDDIPFLVAA